jgi:hypothetical protein
MAPMLFADAIIKNGAKKCLTMEIWVGILHISVIK